MLKEAKLEIKFEITNPWNNYAYWDSQIHTARNGHSGLWFEVVEANVSFEVNNNIYSEESFPILEFLASASKWIEQPSQRFDFFPSGYDEKHPLISFRQNDQIISLSGQLFGDSSENTSPKALQENLDSLYNSLRLSWKKLKGDDISTMSDNLLVYKENLVSINAINFANLLTPGNFQEAEKWLSPSCTYQYKDSILRGEEIIKSFSDNHEGAVKKLDGITYIDGTVEKINGNSVFVIIKDKISTKGESFIYTDRLVITCNDSIGHSSIEKIKHSPIKGEREKLLEFFQTMGVDW